MMRSILTHQLLLWLVVTGSFCWPLNGSAATGSPLEFPSTEKMQLLADDPTWLDLVHYGSDSRQSTVLTDEFFLSPDGKFDPLAELTATIVAYSQEWADNPDEDPRCRFPARYLWLSSKISLPDFQARNPECRQFEKWALPDTVESVSVLMVNGYLGNPASTFGHALLKFNTDSSDDAGLFDLTLNYGALIPEGENTFVYVLRGLFGGYEAGFSDRYFYTQDLVYSHTEFRDIWEYRLNLTDYEQKLLLFHIWEIVGKKFQYYFLRENCAYKLSELLDVIVTEDVLTNPWLWYAPVELFFRLLEIDKGRRSLSGEPLLVDVNYIPSSERKLYYQLQVLGSDEMLAFNDILDSDFVTLPDQLAFFEQQRKISILDALLAYQQYLLIEQGSDPLPETEENRRLILKARFELPAREVTIAPIPDLPPPTTGSPPMTFGVGSGRTDGTHSRILLNWSPYKTEVVGKNSLDGDELVVLDLTAGFSEEDRSWSTDNFSLIKVTHFNTIPVRIKGHNRWSWQLRLGADRLHGEEGEPLDVMANFGAGRAMRLGSLLTVYTMIDLAGHTELPRFRIKPQLGVLSDLRMMKFWGYWGQESDGYSGDFRPVWEGKAQWNLGSKYALKLDIRHYSKTTYNLGLNYFW